MTELYICNRDRSHEMSTEKRALRVPEEKCRKEENIIGQK